MKKTLKVAIFTDAYKPVTNGVVNAIEGLYDTLSSFDHKIYIFAPEYSGYKDKSDNVYRFKSLNFNSEVDFPVGIPYSRRIFKIIHTLGLDIIHCHHPFLIGRLGAYMGNKLNIPVVATLHTQYENYIHYIPLNKIFIKHLTLWALRDFSSKCDALIAPAESRKRQLLKYGIKPDIKVIPNGIDVEKFSKLDGKQVRDYYSIASCDKVLIFVGRVAKEKNLDFLLDCFKVLSCEISNVKLMIVGDGPEKSRIMEKAEAEGISEKIIFTGKIPNEYIGNYYASADIFVSTSITEVHPIVLLEAMASGIPTVAIDSIGYKDTIENGIHGFLCSYNIEDFKEKISILLSNDEMRKIMGKASRCKAHNFSVRTVTGEIIDLYLSLLKN